MYNLDIFYYGRKNDEYFRQLENRKLNFKFNLKYFFWIMMMILFAKQKEEKRNKIYVLYGKMHENIFKNTRDDLKMYHGTVLGNVEAIKSHDTIMGMWSLRKRITILIKGIFIGLKKHVPLKEIWYWVDFVFLSEFMGATKIKEINICGHYDRYAVWISYLCNENHIQFNIYQHGALAEILLPAKILCDKCYVYNEMELEFFNRYVVKNKSCLYEIIGFQSKVIFDRIEKNQEKVYIGIASQPTYTAQTAKIVNIILEVYGEKAEIYVYPHPRENFEELHLLENQGKCKIYTDKKHANLDMMITYFSTIVYDFLSVNQEIDIVCLKPEKIKMAFFYLKQVKLIEHIEELKSEIEKNREKEAVLL